MGKDIEIELKLPLLNNQAVEVLLNKNAKFKYKSFQHDAYYNAPHRNFLENSDNVNEWLRIRIADGSAQINYKDWQPHDSKIKTHCKEYETNVDSYEQLRHILDALNFVHLIDVKKTRQAWNYLDVEVSIDSVEGLGEYIELEYKGQQANISKARDYLFGVLSKLSAKTGELDIRGYPYLLLEKQGLFKAANHGDDNNIKPGAIYLHDEGLKYKVDDVRINTSNYEQTHKVGGRVVNYTQLQDGKFPAGTKWCKDEEGFIKHFKLVA